MPTNATCQGSSGAQRRMNTVQLRWLDWKLCTSSGVSAGALCCCCSCSSLLLEPKPAFKPFLQRRLVAPEQMPVKRLNARRATSQACTSHRTMEPLDPTCKSYAPAMALGGVVRLRPGLPLVQVAEQHIASADGYVGVRWTGSQMGVSMLLLLHGGQQAAFVWPMQVQIQQGASVQCNSTLQRVAGITIISVSGAHPDKGGLATRVDVKCVMAHEGVPTADKSITDNSHAHQPVSELPPRLAEGEACYQLMHAACIQRLHDACT